MTLASSPVASDSAIQRRGVYCLTSDYMVEWFQALARSFRRYNPAFPFTVIPYNQSVDLIRSVCDEFGFSMMDETQAAEFDAIGEKVAGQRNAGHTFRKLCSLFGEYDQFLFLDSDIVVTLDYGPLFEAFSRSDVDMVYFATELHMVYKPDLARQMMERHRTHGFNSGAFLSRREAVSRAEIAVAVESGEIVRDEFANWGDQPFINYLFDVSNRRLCHAAELLPEISTEPWGRLPVRFGPGHATPTDARGKKLPFVHWAGCEYPIMLQPTVFLRYRTLGFTLWQKLFYCLKFYFVRFKRSTKEWLVRRGYCRS